MQRIITDELIEEYLDRNFERYVGDYFKRHFIENGEIKKGNKRCFFCDRLLRAYWKTLDDRLIKMAWDALVFVRKNSKKSFAPREVWGEDHIKLTDFQKLHYWDIIERLGNGYWKVTKKGVNFLTKQLELPKECLVFNNEVIEWGDGMVKVDNPDPRWQLFREDWSMDFLPFRYKSI